MSNKEEIFSDTIVNEDKAVLVIDGETAPDQNSLEWNDWVMDLFDETELVQQDGTGDPMPKVAGLRRVAGLVLGKIVSSGPVTVFPATNVDHPGRSTVVFQVEFQDGTVFREVGESYIDNTDDKFCIYPSAIASTRAEARALRKALGINRVSYDEITSKDAKHIVRESIRTEEAKKDTDGEFKDSNVATDKQINLIGFLCDKLEIDRDNFFSEVIEVKDGETLSKGDASISIDQLHRYRDEKEDIPTSIKK